MSAQWISFLYRLIQKIEQIKPDHCDRYQNNRTKKCNWMALVSYIGIGWNISQISIKCRKSLNLTNVPTISNVGDQCHSIAFLVQLFWYLSQWSGLICSIFCNRLYSKDIHCDLPATPILKIQYFPLTQWISLLNRRVQKIEQIEPDHCDRYQNNSNKKCNWMALVSYIGNCGNIGQISLKCRKSLNFIKLLKSWQFIISLKTFGGLINYFK